MELTRVVRKLEVEVKKAPVINLNNYESIIRQSAKRLQVIKDETAQLKIYERVIKELIAILKAYKIKYALDEFSDPETQVAHIQEYTNDLETLQKLTNIIDVELFDLVSTEVFDNE